MSPLNTLLAPYQCRFEKTLVKEKKIFGKEGRLQDACLYALKAGGKRIRPALVYMVGDRLGGGCDIPAFSIELLHTASLIADDLPCMDDDFLRRGKPALHAAFGETTALLASYALIGAAYEVLGIGCKEKPDITPLALQQIGESTGIRGIAGGQYLDIYHPKERGIEAIEKKTASLFEASLILGWLFGGGKASYLPQVKKAGKRLGIAFQLLDDLLDMDQDKAKDSLNLALEWGVEKTTQAYFKEEEHLLKDLSDLNIRSEPLIALINAFHQEVDRFVCQV